VVAGRGDVSVIQESASAGADLVSVTDVAYCSRGLFSMLGREGPFKAFFSITAFSFVPTVFGQLAGVARVFVIPPSALMLDELGSLSPAVFLERDSVSPVLFTAANMMDLVSIWILILMIIGYGFVTPKSLSKTTRAITVLSLFVIYQAIRLGFVALRGA
jgi:hypothetical protein